ncbi:protein-disulfide reductase DsbD [Massilia brevitalea]|uniref:protein-disulfide reductase DsbD n=1 Tax=Massilia brevitalea TaxID=442526 RepID=UPI0027399DC2|nr:protein-disulfide reductase DsbD [Massilia brevitalea]
MSLFRLRSIRAPLFAALSLLFIVFALLATPGRAQDFLDPAVAFKFSARMDGERTAVVTYDIAPGYYMYRERFAFTARGATLGAPQIPAGKVKFDETFGKEVETYHGSVTIRIPVDGSGQFTLNATSQGCADAGLCYPPQEHNIQLTAAGGAAPQASIPRGANGSTPPPLSSAPQGEGGAAARLGLPVERAQAVDTPAQAAAQPQSAAGTPATSDMLRAANPAPSAAAAGPAPSGAIANSASSSAAAPSDLSAIDSVLQGGRLLAIVPAFILLGLGLAFTPCVLPMVPILSSIIVGEGGKAKRSRGLVLSITYSLGMAIVYTALGVAAGLIGEGLAAALQNPWVLGAFAQLIVAMAMSMFGFYELQVPASLQTRLSGVSNRQASGKLAGVFAMGAISALIVGPCVAAPLAGALVYISQTRDVLVGGAALFSMAVGMSIPLLLVGVSAGSLLPKAGAWMDSVKRFFGVLMLAMALWLVSPVLPASVQMILWAALLLGYGSYLLRRRGHWAALAFGAAFGILGAMQLAGVASGGRDPLAPLAHLTGTQKQPLHFQRVKTVVELDAALANLGGKTAMLDFYADWCVSCKEMEKLTFVDPQVQARLANTVLLQVDVTANDADDKAMLKRFGLFGPPGIIFFDAGGKEIAGSRVIGYQNASKFLMSLERLD